LEADDIRALRKRLGLSMGQLGEKLGVPQALIIQWEHGDGFPTKAHVARLEKLARGEDPLAGKRSRKATPGSFYAPILADESFAVLLRKLLFHEELRARALELAAEYDDPAGS
jgi:transcriptional regulator with XRE-family HTH domain